jgi:hypothetical protein
MRKGLHQAASPFCLHVCCVRHDILALTRRVVTTDLPAGRCTAGTRASSGTWGCTCKYDENHHITVVIIIIFITLTIIISSLTHTCPHVSAPSPAIHPPSSQLRPGPHQSTADMWSTASFYHACTGRAALVSTLCEACLTCACIRRLTVSSGWVKRRAVAPAVAPCSALISQRDGPSAHHTTRRTTDVNTHWTSPRRQLSPAIQEELPHPVAAQRSRRRQPGTDSR